MTQKLQILVGMIASGKSTYAKSAALAGFICTNDDTIVNLIHADQYIAYDKKLKILYKEIEHNIIAIGLSLGRTVVVDRGLNISKKSRNRFISIAQSYDIPCEAIVFPKDNIHVHAERRFRTDSRGRTLEWWQRVAITHEANYVIPSLEEGFSKIYYPTIEEIKNGKVYR